MKFIKLLLLFTFLISEISLASGPTIVGKSGSLTGGLATGDIAGSVKVAKDINFSSVSTGGNSSIPGGSVWTTISTWVDEGTSSYYASGTYTVKETGFYFLGGKLKLNAMSNAQIRLYMNGTTEVNLSPLLSGTVVANTVLNMGIVVKKLTKGDTIVFQAKQGDGGARGTLNSSGGNSFFVTSLGAGVITP